MMIMCVSHAQWHFNLSTNPELCFSMQYWLYAVNVPFAIKFAAQSGDTFYFTIIKSQTVVVLFCLFGYFL